MAADASPRYPGAFAVVAPYNRVSVQQMHATADALRGTPEAPGFSRLVIAGGAE